MKLDGGELAIFAPRGKVRLTVLIFFPDGMLEKMDRTVVTVSAGQTMLPAGNFHGILMRKQVQGSIRFRRGQASQPIIPIIALGFS